MRKRQLIAIGAALTAPLLGAAAMTAATVAVAHAIVTGTIIHRAPHVR
jgi:hypothetical protein